jgi:hypothetical protein
MFSNISPRQPEGRRGCRTAGSRWRGLANKESPPTSFSCRHRPRRDHRPLLSGFCQPPSNLAQPSSYAGLLPPVHRLVAPFCNKSSSYGDCLQQNGAMARDILQVDSDDGVDRRVMTLSKCAISLGLQVQSDVAREFFPQGLLEV